MTDFITSGDLAGFIKNVTAADEPWLSDAAAVGCAKVVELCGPVLTEQVTDKRVKGTLRFRAASLVSVQMYIGGAVQDVADYDVDGQLLFRRDGCRIYEPLTVTYKTGSATAPIPLKSAALQIAQQHLRAMRRFAATGESTPVGFLVPNSATELMRNYLLLLTGFA